MTRHAPPPIIYVTATAPNLTAEPHRQCTLCRYKLPPHHFHQRTRGGRQNICKKCRTVYQRDHNTYHHHQRLSLAMGLDENGNPPSVRDSDSVQWECSE